MVARFWATSVKGYAARAFSAAMILGVCPSHAQQELNNEADLGPLNAEQRSVEKQIADFASENAQNAKQSCQIIIQSNGRLAPNVGATKLTSLGFSGEPARADITTSTGSYYVSVDQPLGFVQAPQGGNNDITFATWMSGRGKTSFGDTPGQNRVKLKNGLTNMEIGLEVIKQNGAFPTGRYQAELILRCE